jgi:hypothetical protein
VKKSEKVGISRTKSEKSEILKKSEEKRYFTARMALRAAAEIGQRAAAWMDQDGQRVNRGEEWLAKAQEGQRGGKTDGNGGAHG